MRSQTFFRLAENCQKDCLVICDRGSMDPAAYMDEDGWKRILTHNGFNLIDFRDNRYHQVPRPTPPPLTRLPWSRYQVIHLTTAADGAEEFYTQANNVTRSEGLDQALKVDKRTQKASHNGIICNFHFNWYLGLGGASVLRRCHKQGDQIVR